jgi:phosphoribosyl 1,2-cyclic phosphodiesterase
MKFEFCSLASGSKGNSQYVATNDTGLLVDAGMSGKYIENALGKIDRNFDKIQALLVTHEHSDHIAGIGVLMRRYKLPLYVNEKTWEAMKNKIGKIDISKVNIIENNVCFNVGNIIVNSYSISHDANDPIGYIFEYKNKKISLATDLGYVSEEIIEKIKDTDLLFIESNHDTEMLKAGRYPYYLKRRVLSMEGHLSNDEAGRVAKEVTRFGRVKYILLAHLSNENNFPELAFETVKTILKGGNIEVGKDVDLEMTHREDISKLFSV